MPPTWLTVVFYLFMGLAFVCAAAILYDVFGRGYPQHMRIMEVVWPVTALYLGPLAFWTYGRWGRPVSHKWTEEYGDPPKKYQAPATAVGTSDCGADGISGDIVGSPTVVFVPGWQMAGTYLYAEYVVDYVLAFVLGIALQYYSIKPMRGPSPREGLVAALKADFLSLTSFRVGLYGWMAVMQFVLFPGGMHISRPRGFLVSGADRHDPGVRYFPSGQGVAHPARDQGGDATMGAGGLPFGGDRG